MYEMKYNDWSITGFKCVPILFILNWNLPLKKYFQNLPKIAKFMEFMKTSDMMVPGGGWEEEVWE